MLCAECGQPAIGGTQCPQCDSPVPERETFGGQGGHYLRVLLATSVVLFAGFLVYGSRGSTLAAGLQAMLKNGWLLVLGAIALLPAGIGFYYWAILRNEEIIVTDEYIERRSYWGDQRLDWRQVTELRRETIAFSQTRLGSISRLSRYLTDRKIVSRFPPIYLELVARQGDGDEERVMRLEPGTIDDMGWLLRLIEERVHRTPA